MILCLIIIQEHRYQSQETQIQNRMGLFNNHQKPGGSIETQQRLPPTSQREQHQTQRTRFLSGHALFREMPRR